MVRLYGIVAAILLPACISGCSVAIPASAGASVSPLRQSGALERPQSEPDGELYVSQFKALNINAYSARGNPERAPICTLPVKEVNSIGVDASGTLWVPQQNNNNGTQSILSFGPHCGAQGITLSDSDGFPTAIAFDSSGTNYVENAQTYPSGPGNVLVFPKGATVPARTLTNSAFRFLTAINVDAANNLFVLTISAGNRGTLLEFNAGKMPGRIVNAKVTAGVPGGALLFDRSGNLVVDDYESGTLDIFAPPYHAQARRAKLQGVSWQCAFNRVQTKLVCADSQNGAVDVYAYPSLQYLYRLTSGLAKVATVVGVAFDPATPR